MSTGLLTEIQRRLQTIGLRGTPAMTDNYLVITVTEDEFKATALRDVEPWVRDAIEIKFEPGKMVIRVRLF